MALGSNISGQPMNTTNGQQFIPEIWLNEVQMFRKARMFDTSLMKTFGAEVRKGDTFHIPRISELGVEDKATDIPVAVQSTNDTDFVVQVDTDRTTAVMLDNLLEIQSAYDLRSPYLQAMGYALAKDMTGSILGLRAALMANANANVFSSSTGTIAGNGAPLNLASILTARRVLLENDVPMDGMALILSPGQESALFRIPEFTSIDYTNMKPLANGEIGSIMGIRIIRSSLVGANSTTGWRNGALGAPEPTPGVAGSRYMPKQDAAVSLPLVFTGNSQPVHTAVLIQTDWAVGVVSKSPKVTQSFENRDQAWLMVGRQAYGTRLYRPNHAINIHTNGNTI